MKKIVTGLFVISVLASMNACASIPQPGELDNLARVHFGETVPANQNYVLVFDAGQKIPLNIQVNGGLIGQGLDKHEYVTLNRTIYTYKKWASFDGETWVAARKLIDLSVKVKLPGYRYPHPGEVQIKLSEKK